MTERDLATLRSAVAALEHPGACRRLTNMVGKPIELIGYALPASASQAITAATTKALEMALEVALPSLHQGPRPGSQRLHKALAPLRGELKHSLHRARINSDPKSSAIPRTFKGI